MNIENSHLIFMSALVRERLYPLILFLTELWHLLDVSAVAGHGAVLAALLFHIVNFVIFHPQYTDSGYLL